MLKLVLFFNREFQRTAFRPQFIFAHCSASFGPNFAQARGWPAHFTFFCIGAVKNIIYSVPCIAFNHLYVTVGPKC
jgi:hypothetical protein